MSPFLASPGLPSSGGATSSRRLWSGVRDVREQNQRRPDPRHEEGGRGDGLEWDPVTRWHCGPHPPDLCPGRPGPGPLLGTAGAKTVLKAMPLSFAGLTDLRGPERQCPTHSGGPSSSVTCQPPSVLVPVQCPPPHTLPPGQASTAPPPPAPTVPNGCRGWTAFGLWQSGPFHGQSSSLPLSRTGTSPPPHRTCSCHKCFVNNSCRRRTADQWLPLVVGPCIGVSEARNWAAAWPRAGVLFVFVVRRAPTRYGGGARSHLYIAEHVRVTGIQRRIQSIQDAMASTTHGCGPSYMTTEIATDGPCGRPYIS